MKRTIRKVLCLLLLLLLFPMHTGSGGIGDNSAE